MLDVWLLQMDRADPLPVLIYTRCRRLLIQFTGEAVDYS